MQLKNLPRTLKTRSKAVLTKGIQRVRFRPGCVDRFAFIFGCQRSGTTMLGRCFSEDVRVIDYGEYGLAGNDLRIPPLEAVRDIANRQHAPVFVAKPLVESHRVNEILDYFPNAYGIWMLRHYKDVANSSRKLFGVEATRTNLGAIVNEDRNHWMAAGVSDAVRDTVVRLYHHDMPPLDGKALIWYVRNSLFFEQRLAEKKNMMLLHYADITSDPPRIMKDVYHFIDVSYPGDHIVAAVHGKSVGLGNTVELDPEIETLCEDMWNRFQQLTP